MKWRNRVLLVTVFLLFLTGCSSNENNHVTFYYCKDPEQYEYFSEDGVIYAESRELVGHRDDLPYMVGLYLAGPMEEGLLSPFARGTRLLSVSKADNTVLIELSNSNSTLSDSEFTLACASLTLTCMDFTTCDQVTITSGERSITMNTDTILLYDTLPQQETTGG